MRLEKRQRFRGMVDEGGPEIARRSIADDLIKVAQHLVTTVTSPRRPATGPKAEGTSRLPTARSFRRSSDPSPG